ncbi:MAG: hypothetical protein WCJ61_17690 [Paludibacter sp.]
MKKQNLFVLLSVIAITACQPSLKLPTDSENSLNLNSLLTLKIGNNSIYLQDFISKPNEIDSITSTSAKLICTIDSSKTTATLVAAPNMEAFVDVKLWTKGIAYSVPCRKTNKIDYVFTYNPSGKTYKKVQIAGQMNDWAPTLSPDLKLNAKGIYEVTLNLSPGTYLYQMVLDGDQNHDATNPNKVDNGYGKFNSILQVAGNSDKFPKLHTEKYNYTTITLSTENDVKEVYIYWQNFLIPTKYFKYSGLSLVLGLNVIVSLV